MSQVKSDILSRVINNVKELSFPNKPNTLYDPIHYFLALPSKKIRPILVHLINELYTNGEFLKDAKHLSNSVELFHNFSLVHDDIMDEADLRRNQQTVHHKWNLNQAILSGDALLIKAYEELSQVSEDILLQSLNLFNESSRLVCEGQQYDMDYETIEKISVHEYLEMIRLKTAVLIGASLQFGAISARCSANEQRILYEIGEEMGVTFQIQDDYLDVFGNPEKFGKTVGGDILNSKKTILYLKALEQTKNTNDFTSLYTSSHKSKVKKVKALFESLQINKQIEQEIETRVNKTNKKIELLTLKEDKKTELKQFFTKLMNRQN